MRHNIYIIIAIILFSGCKKVLEEHPTDFIGPGNFYKNSDDALAAVNGAYSALHDYYSNYEYLMILELPTETVGKEGETLNNDRVRLDEFLWDANHPYLLSFYTAAYKATNVAASVIDKVPDVEMNEALKTRIIAEAKFLRALTYFNLVRLFGDVPLKKASAKGLEDAKLVTRDPVASVYEFIIEDLNFAIENLPSIKKIASVDIGRASSEAAKTLMAKVYLTKGSLNDKNSVPQEIRIGTGDDFQKASAYLNEIIQEKSRKLIDYNNLWGFGTALLHENNEEVIFDIQNIAQGGFGAGISDKIAPFNSPLTHSEGGDMQAELPFYNSFAGNDVRKTVTFVTSYEINGKTVVYDQNDIEGTGFRGKVPGFYKLLKPDLTAQDPNNFVVLRYADVLLMYAEALNEVNNGPNTEAYKAINQVRERAGLSFLMPDLTYRQFKDSLFVERRKELVLEGHGWFDSQRYFSWFKERVELSSGFGNTDFGPSTKIKVEDPKFRLMPIPQVAIDINPNLTQNPGW